MTGCLGRLGQFPEFFADVVKLERPLGGRGGGPEELALPLLVFSEGNGGGMVCGRWKASFDGREHASERSGIPLSDRSDGSGGGVVLGWSEV